MENACTWLKAAQELQSTSIWSEISLYSAYRRLLISHIFDVPCNPSLRCFLFCVAWLCCTLFRRIQHFLNLKYARNISHHNENTQSVWQSMQVRADRTLKKKSKGIRLLQNSDEFVQTVGSGFWDAIKKECDQRKFSINYRKCMQNPNAWFYENIPMELFRSIISRTIWKIRLNIIHKFFLLPSSKLVIHNL